MCFACRGINGVLPENVSFNLRVEVENSDNDIFLLVYGRVVITISAIATVQYC